MKIIKLLIASAILCLLSGCISMQLQQPLPKRSRIGVYSSYKNTAEFKHIGTTMFQNNEYKKTLPDLNINSKISNELIALLRRNQQAGIYVEQKMPKRFFVSGLGSFEISKQGKTYLNRLKNRYNINYLLLVRPGVYCYNKDSDNSLATINGYGVFYRSFIWIKRIYAVAGYNIYLIDLSAQKILAQVSGSTANKLSLSLWKNKPDQLRPSDLRTVARIIKTELPRSISGKVINMMRL